MARARRVRAVLDTSVLLSADRRPLIFLAAAGAYTIVWSEYIIDELKRKMREIGWGQANSEALVNTLTSLAEIVDYTQIEGGNYEEWLLDPDDHPIMATAIMGKVDFLVTWNVKDFPPKRRFAGTTIVTPDAFLRDISSEAGRP